jgi:hypothetical protein
MWTQLHGANRKLVKDTIATGAMWTQLHGANRKLVKDTIATGAMLQLDQEHSH